MTAGAENRIAVSVNSEYKKQILCFLFVTLIFSFRSSLLLFILRDNSNDLDSDRIS